MAPKSPSLLWPSSSPTTLVPRTSVPVTASSSSPEGASTTPTASPATPAAPTTARARVSAPPRLPPTRTASWAATSSTPTPPPPSPRPRPRSRSRASKAPLASTWKVVLVAPRSRGSWGGFSWHLNLFFPYHEKGGKLGAWVMYYLLQPSLLG